MLTRSSFLKAAIVPAAAVAALSGCTPAAPASKYTDKTLTPAARTCGQDVYEEGVIMDVDSIKSLDGIDGDEAFASWLRVRDLTPEKLREALLDARIESLLLLEAFKDYEVFPSMEELEAAMDAMVSGPSWQPPKGGSFESAAVVALAQSESVTKLMEKIAPEEKYSSAKEREAALEEWLKAYRETKNTEIYPMPGDLPYAIDMDKYDAFASEKADTSQVFKA